MSTRPSPLFFVCLSFEFWILIFIWGRGRLYAGYMGISLQSSSVPITGKYPFFKHPHYIICYLSYFQIYFESSSRNKTLTAGSWYVIKLKPCVIPNKQRTWTDVLRLAWVKVSLSPKFDNSHCVATVNPVALREDPLDLYILCSFWIFLLAYNRFCL